MVDLSETVLFAARVRAAVEAFYGDAPRDPETSMRLVRALEAAEAVTQAPPPSDPRLPRAMPFSIVPGTA